MFSEDVRESSIKRIELTSLVKKYRQRTTGIPRAAEPPVDYFLRHRAVVSRYLISLYDA